MIRSYDILFDECALLSREQALGVDRGDDSTRRADRLVVFGEGVLRAERSAFEESCCPRGRENAL